MPPRKHLMDFASLYPSYSFSIHLEPYRQLLRAIDKIGLGHLDLAVEGDRFQPRQQFLEQDAHLELGQILPEAEMRAIAERDMTVRLAVAAKLVRLLEHVLVAIAGGVAQHQPVTLCNLAAAELGVSRGRAHKMLDRGHPADCLVDQARDQIRIGLHLFELRWV